MYMRCFEAFNGKKSSLGLCFPVFHRRCHTAINVAYASSSKNQANLKPWWEQEDSRFTRNLTMNQLTDM